MKFSKNGADNSFVAIVDQAAMQEKYQHMLRITRFSTLECGEKGLNAHCGMNWFNVLVAESYTSLITSRKVDGISRRHFRRIRVNV